MMEINSLGCLLLAVIGLQMVMMVHSQRFPSRKLWWAKKVTKDLFVIGRPTSSEIKFAKESGIKSIITVEFFPTTEYIGTDRTDPLLSTPEVAQLAMDIGLNFSYMLNHSNWATLESMQTFSALFDSSPKPVLLNCKTAYSSVFIGLMHYFNRSKTDPNAEPRINVTTFFKKAVAQGFDFAVDEINHLKDLVLTVDGSINATPKEETPRTDIDIPSWMAWKLKPLGKNIYIAGQIGSHELSILIAAGYKALVNLRKGVTSGGSPSQEEAILLNIKDRTGTYDTTGKPVRQTRVELERNRINPLLPPTYISPPSGYNYQSINELQFGDDVGYNETLERLVVSNTTLTYMHTPVGGVYKYGLPLWEAYRDQLLDLGRTSSGIVLQCRTGYRSAVVGLLLHGCLYGVNSTEALQLAYELGYEFEADREVAVVTMFRTILDNREQYCESPTTTTVAVPPAFTTAAATCSRTSVLVLVLVVIYGLCSRQFA